MRWSEQRSWDVCSYDLASPHTDYRSAAAGPRRFQIRSQDETTYHKSCCRFKLLSAGERVYFSHQSERCSSLQFQLISFRSILPWANREHMIVGEWGSCHSSCDSWTERLSLRHHSHVLTIIKPRRRNIPCNEACQCRRLLVDLIFLK